jgi:hypothetical protein
MMEKRSYVFGTIFLIAAYLLSACNAVAIPDSGDLVQIDGQAQSQDLTSEVAYTGVIEAINGSQWLINGVELTVGSSMIQGGPFIVGDTVRVEGNVSSDGSLIVSQVLSPTASDLSGLPALGVSADVATGDGNDNSNDNTNDNSNDNTNDNSNDNTNDDDNDNDNTNDNSNDDDDDDDNSNDNTNDDDDDDDNSNDNTNDDDDDDDNSNDNTNDDDDDDDNSNDNTNDDDDDDDNSNDS